MEPAGCWYSGALCHWYWPGGGGGSDIHHQPHPHPGHESPQDSKGSQTFEDGKRDKITVGHSHAGFATSKLKINNFLNPMKYKL